MDTASTFSISYADWITEPRNPSCCASPLDDISALVQDIKSYSNLHNIAPSVVLGLISVFDSVSLAKADAFSKSHKIISFLGNKIQICSDVYCEVNEALTTACCLAYDFHDKLTIDINKALNQESNTLLFSITAHIF
uniref:Uncharacterized protein n=1 Tax=Glossina austeni TaxID=7395 RepID=A0A1A9USH3_GLOAU